MRTQVQQIVNKWIGEALIVALIAFALGSPVVAQSSGEQSAPPKALPRIGQVEQGQGTAFLWKTGQKGPIPAGAQTPVHVQDVLFTQADSKLWWHFPDLQADPKDASMGRDSYLRFHGYARSGSVTNMSAEVGRGIIRFITKLPETNPTSSFTVNSPTAFAWAQPGEEQADFVVEVYDEFSAKITVIWGSVAVKNVSEDLETVRLLKSCQTVTVERDQDPGPVTWVSSDTLRSLISQTTIPGTLSEDVPSCERTAEADPPEEYPVTSALIPPVVLIVPEIVIIPGDDPPETTCPVCYEPVVGGCAPLTCPEGMIFNAATPGCCTCPPCHEFRDGRCQPVICPDRAEFDPTAPGCCRCAQCHEVRDGECLQIQCPANNEFSVTAPGCCRPCGRCEQVQANGQCGPIQCPEGGIYDPSAESCCTFLISGPPKNAAPPAPQIGAPFRMVPFNPPGVRFPDGDPNECYLQCPKGQRVDRVACRCVPTDGCNLKCPKGQRLDPAACKCVRDATCNRTCPPGQILDSAACKCLPKMTHKDTAKRTTFKRTDVVKPHNIHRKPRITPSFKQRNQAPMMRMKPGKRFSSCVECDANQNETSSN